MLKMRFVATIVIMSFVMSVTSVSREICSADYPATVSSVEEIRFVHLPGIITRKEYPRVRRMVTEV